MSFKLEVKKENIKEVNNDPTLVRKNGIARLVPKLKYADMCINTYEDLAKYAKDEHGIARLY